VKVQGNSKIALGLLKENEDHLSPHHMQPRPSSDTFQQCQSVLCPPADTKVSSRANHLLRFAGVADSWPWFGPLSLTDSRTLEGTSHLQLTYVELLILSFMKVTLSDDAVYLRA
jgi:hypothetical protein